MKRSMRSYLRREISSRCWLLLYFVLHLPAAAIQRFVLWIGPKHVEDQIRIVCIEETMQVEFLDSVRQALRLLARFDKVRYLRAQNEIRRIIYLPSKSGAEYFRILRVCVIDPNSLKRVADGMEFVPLLACVLVHEATHGRMLSRRIPYCGQTKDRIELVCCREMRRFANRADLGRTPWDGEGGALALAPCDSHNARITND